MTAVVTRRDPPDERFALVNPVWGGETVAIICTGPSLTREQVGRCRGLRAIVVNDGYLWAPWADVCYFADSKWWNWHAKRPEFRAFAGLKVSIENARPPLPDDAALFLRNGSPSGVKFPLSDDPGAIHTGHNSGYQALNIALLAGASRVIFLGLDGRPDASGRKHCFGDHPDKTEPPYAAMKSAFRLAADECRNRGVDVVNCSPGTAIDCFRTGAIEAELAACV